MAKPYDVGVKVLMEAHLPDWLALVPRVPRGKVRVIDSDLATVTAEADKVLLVEDPQPWILHVELQSGFDKWLANRIAWYNALLAYKHRCPVHSLVVLLHRKADMTSLTGELTEQIGSEPPYRIFRYQVVRAWQLDAKQLASGGWGLFPLAPLSDTAPPMLADLVDGMARRLASEHADLAEARELGTVLEILLGLRYSQELTKLMIEKVNHMIDLQESHAYQIILNKGKAEGRAEGRLESLRESIMLAGKKKFGKPGARAIRSLNGITDTKRLTKLIERILDVNSWSDLFADQDE